jgi:type VI secretion system protein ImpC
MFRQFRDAAWDQSPLFKKVYEAEFGQLGGQPYGAFICDYAFDHSAPISRFSRASPRSARSPRADHLGGRSQPARHGKLAGAGQSARLAKQFDATDYMSPGARSASRTTAAIMALTLPRFLGRPLYGANSEPVEEFAFEEDTDGGQHDNYLWLNASYALGVRITEAFKTYGWCTRIRGVESGGTVEGLPTAMFPTDDGAWTPSARPRSQFPIVAKPSCPRPA